MDKKTTSVVVSVLIIFKIFGLVPFSIITWKESKLVILISNSKTSIIYNMILIIMTIYANCFNTLFTIIENDIRSADDLDPIMGFVSVASSTLICIILWIMFSINHKRMEEAAHEFIAIDSFLKKQQHIEKLELPRWQCISMTFTYGILWSAIIWCQWLCCGGGNWFIWAYTLIMTGVTVNLCLLQYAFVMNLIKFRFQSLNNAIAKVGIGVIQSKNGTSLECGIVENETTMNVFESIKCAYHMLYDLASIISDFYSFPTLIIMGALCLLIIYIVFDILSSYILTPSSVDPISLVNDVLWLSVTVFPITVLITTLETLTKEYKKMPIEIFKLTSRLKDCKRLLNEAQWFVQEFAHKPMEFTAFGFFKLDSTFFRSIFTTTMTYLIIVLQLQASHQKTINAASENSSIY